MLVSCSSYISVISRVTFTSLRKLIVRVSSLALASVAAATLKLKFTIMSLFLLPVVNRRRCVSPRVKVKSTFSDSFHTHSSYCTCNTGAVLGIDTKIKRGEVHSHRIRVGLFFRNLIAQLKFYARCNRWILWRNSTETSEFKVLCKHEICHLMNKTSGWKDPMIVKMSLKIRYFVNSLQLFCCHSRLSIFLLESSKHHPVELT